MIPKSAVKIDKSRDNLFDEMGLRRLRDSYMRPQESSPQERFSYAVRAVASNAAHAQRLYDYVSKHWLSLSTPLLSYGASKRGLPISCYLSWVPDTSEGLVDTVAEISWLSMLGGGVGLGLGIRSEDNKSVGVMPHCKVYEAVSLAYRQNGRRGSFATYLDISHPNIMQFIDMRKPTGDANQRCQELHHGVNIPDSFMEIIERCMLDADADDAWPLIDPATGAVKEVVSAKFIWENILTTRARTGEPFIHWIDTSNNAMPEFQKALGLRVQQSNICTEILLATNAERTAICCLSSPNLEYWECWKDNYQFYKDVAEMLDNAITLFCEKAPEEVKRAVYSAQQERAIGIGALGFHALLQSKGIPFESALAVSLNHQIFSRYKKYLDRANLELGAQRGECPDATGYGLRFSHMTAIAPNASSSIIMGNTSPSIEPFRNNGYRQDTISGSYMNFNKYLAKILKERVPSEEEFDRVRSAIIVDKGSVRHCEYLTAYEKDIFKTFAEIDQNWIIAHAADRQPYIDQGQSVNLAFEATAPIKLLHHVTFSAWKRKLPTLYYSRSEKLYHGSSTNKSTEVFKYDFLQSLEVECLACE